MKTIKGVGAIIKYDGKLCEVVSWTDEKVLFIREIGAKPCPSCGETKEYSEVESSPNFQERAERIETLSE